MVDLLLQLLVFGLTSGAVVALSAAGFTLTYAVSRQINLAHGNVFALTTVAVASLARVLGVTAVTPVGLRVGALVVLLAFGALCGALLNGIVERLAFRPFDRRGDPLGPLIASMALSFMMLGVAVRWHAWTSVPMPGHQGVNLPLLALPDLLPAIDLGAGGVMLLLKDVVVLALAGAVALGGSAALLRTRGGRLLRAIAEDREQAALCGVDAGRGRLYGFIAAGGLAGLAAAVFATYHGGTTANQGLQSGLTAMTAAFLGGIGDPRGALLGGLALGVFGAYSDFWLSAFWTPVLVLVLLVGLLAFRPLGILGGALPTALDVPREHVRIVVGWGRRHAQGALGLLLVLAAAYPLVGHSPLGSALGLNGTLRLYDATVVVLLIALTVGLGVVVGFAGLLDLGYAAFFAVGGYTAAVVTSTGSCLVGLPAALRDPWLALPLAGLVAATVGIGFGLPTIRTRGEYLAIVTLALGELVPASIVRFPSCTGGPRGISGIRAPTLSFLPGDGPLQTYIVALALAALACVVAGRLAGSRLGRAWAAVRDDEVAAAAVGVNAVRAKLRAFALGAGVAGLAGAIYAGLLGSIVPEQFDLTLSLMVLAAVVLGARGGIAGLVIAALLVAAYDRAIVDLLTTGLRALGSGLGIGALATADLRGDNFAVFGLVLYLATLVPTGGLPRPAAERTSRTLEWPPAAPPSGPPGIERPGAV
ncbi:MAG: ABC transporter permease [Chloroflexi bacterium]|nr:ABC transporter permease [Chloroflexota bacterium]